MLCKYMENGVWVDKGKLYLHSSLDILAIGWFGWFMVFKATFNSISVISRQPVLLVEETRVPRENH